MCEFCEDIKRDHDEKWYQDKPFQINEYQKGETYWTSSTRNPLDVKERRCEEKIFTLRHEAADEYYSFEMVIYYCPVCGKRLGEEKFNLKTAVEKEEKMEQDFWDKVEIFDEMVEKARKEAHKNGN